MYIPTILFRYFNVYGSRQALSNPYTGCAAIFTSRTEEETLRIGGKTKANTLSDLDPFPQMRALTLEAGMGLPVLILEKLG